MMTLLKKTANEPLCGHFRLYQLFSRMVNISTTKQASMNHNHPWLADKPVQTFRFLNLRLCFASLKFRGKPYGY